MLLALLLQEGWIQVRLDAVLRADGAVEVVQTMTWSGPPRDVTWGLDRAGLDRIEVLEAPSVREESRITWIEWAAGTQPTTLRYVVWGAVTEDEPAFGFAWRAVSEFRDAPVQSVDIRLRMPKASDVVVVHAQSALRDATLSVSPDLIVYRGTGLYDRESVTLQARLPAGLVEPPFLLRRELKTRLGTVLMFALPGAVFLVMLGLYLARGRDPRVAGSVAEDDLPPAMAGLIMDEEAGPAEASAVIVDLLRRGAIEAGGSTLTLVTTDGLAEYERRVVRSIFGEATTADLGGARPDGAPDGAAAIYAEGVARGWFRRSPQAERAAYRWAGVAFLAAGAIFALATARDQLLYLPALLMLGLPLVVMAFAAHVETPRPMLILLFGGAALLLGAVMLVAPWLTRVGFTWQAKVALGITLCGPILLGMAPVMPAKTLAGAEAKERAAAGMRSLESASPEAFEARLAHAVALRCKKSFIARAAEDGATTPSWWSPSGEPLAAHAEALAAFLGALSARFGRETRRWGGG